MTNLIHKPQPRLRRQLRRPREKRLQRPRLKFTPTAWAKLLCLRDLGPTEIGGFGIASTADLLRVEAVRLVSQTCSVVTVTFDDTAVADFFEEQVDQGRRPEQFARIWIHTHPGNSPRPSPTDLATFRRCFGECDWAVMFILARNDSTHAELHWRNGGGRLLLGVEIDYSQEFAGSDFAAWRAEYDTCVRPEGAKTSRSFEDWPGQGFDMDWPDPFSLPGKEER